MLMYDNKRPDHNGIDKANTCMQMKALERRETTCCSKTTACRIEPTKPNLPMEKVAFARRNNLLVLNPNDLKPIDDRSTAT